MKKILPPKGKIATKKEKSISLWTTKGGGTKKDMIKSMVSDESSSLIKELMTLLSKIFTRFFHSK